MTLSAFLYAALLASSLAGVLVAAADNTYAPRKVDCPDRNLLRDAGTVQGGNQALSAKEQEYIDKRRAGPVAKAFKDYMGRHHLGYDLTKLAPSAKDWPIVGIAVSGGGFRASSVGAGTFNALDGRNEDAVKAGTGGVYQLASYMTGLSGGSWFVSSLAINNQPSFRDIVLGSDKIQGWFLDRHLMLPSKNLIKTARYYDNLKDNVALKRDAGFDVQYADPWSLALSYKFGPGGTSEYTYFDESETKNNIGSQWGDIRNTQAFKDADLPFPAVVACSRPPGFSAPVDKLENYFIPLDSNVYEFNPFEFGSWDSQLGHFVELDYTGTELVSGKPKGKKSCVNNFANFGFVIGTSSSLFNAVVQRGNSTLLGVAQKILNKQLTKLSDELGVKVAEEDDEVVNYPSSFQGLKPGTYAYSDKDELDLVDGGEAGANVPLDPLLVKARKVDTIIAVDGSADTDDHWPNGMSLRASFDRAQLLKGQQILPFFPSVEEFRSENGYAQRPTFFGCDANESEISQGMAMYIYLPNTPSKKGYKTNVSTYDLLYDDDEQKGFLDSMFETTTRGFPQGGKDQDEDWGDCLACAIVERKRQAAKLERTDKCEKCFERYCYRM